MKRHVVLILVAAVIGFGALLADADAQDGRLGVISPLSADAAAANMTALRDSLRDLGWIEGQNLAIEYRYADGRFERIPDWTSELVRLGSRVLLVGGTTPAQIAHKAGPPIPIVFVGVSDPVRIGLVASLARPGGNATGLATTPENLSAGKSIDLLKEALPRATRLAVLYNSTNRANIRYLSEAETNGRRAGIAIEGVEASDRASLDHRLGTLVKKRFDGVLVPTDPYLVSQRVKIITATTRAALPTMFGFREFVDAGGLMSYGASLPPLYRRAAVYIDKILKGAKAADLPIEQPTRFELAINLNTAKTLGLKIPPSLLLRADHIVE